MLHGLARLQRRYTRERNIAALRSIVLALWLLLSLLAGCGEVSAPEVPVAPTPASTRGVPRAEPEHRVFLWQTRSKQATAYLLGSIHLANAALYPLDPRIEDAFQHSTTLVLETELDDEVMARHMETFIESALLPPGQSAYDDLDPELRERLVARMVELDLDPERLSAFKLWFITLTLSVRSMEQAGYSGEHGIDRHFYDRALQRQIPVLGLEQVEDQLKLLLAMSDEARSEDVQKALDVDETARMGVIFDEWQRGEAAALRADIEAIQNDYPAFYDELLLKRNHVMADGIVALLAKPGTYFVVVGAGHLVGTGNVLELLEQRGFTMTQL